MSMRSSLLKTLHSSDRSRWQEYGFNCGFLVLLALRSIMNIYFRLDSDLVRKLMKYTGNYQVAFTEPEDQSNLES